MVTQTNKIGIVLLVDGCVSEYFDSARMPFTSNIIAKGAVTSMRFPPCFSTGLILQTGRWPSTTDTFVDLCRMLPWKRPNCLKNKVTLRYQPNPFSPAPLLRAASWILQGVPGHFEGVSWRSLCRRLFSGQWAVGGNVPNALQKLLTPNTSIRKWKLVTNSASRKHLFGALREFGWNVSFVYGATKMIDRRMPAYRPTENSLFWIHYGDSDYYGHHYPFNSSVFGSILRDIDLSARKWVERLQPDFIIILGDHDMQPIYKTVDLWADLCNLPLRIGYDYILVLNSPLARFWCADQSARTFLKEHLAKQVEWGHLVSKVERMKAMLPIDAKYGELIFWAKKGVNFTPDFYHTKPLAGMHGYFDASARTLFAVYKKTESINLPKEMDMVDVAPTVAAICGTNIDSADGRNIIG